MSATTLAVDTASPIPPFEQLRSQIATQVSNGQLPAGTKLATVRQLASELGLAPGTVARAYRELEADNVIATHGRRGTFVRSEVLDTADAGTDTAHPRGQEVAGAAGAYAAVARGRGLTLAEAQALVERVWRR